MAGMGIRVLTIVAAMFAGAAKLSALAAAQDSKPDWREQYAYTLGVQAYIYVDLA